MVELLQQKDLYQYFITPYQNGQKGESIWKGTTETLLPKISLEWKSVPRISAVTGGNWQHSGIMCWSYQLLRRDLIITRATEFVGFFGRSVWIVCFFFFFKLCLKGVYLFGWLMFFVCLCGGIFCWGFLCLSKAVSGEQRSEKTSSVVFPLLVRK